jgi:F-type H+-transporting ATPase subunit gamma
MASLRQIRSRMRSIHNIHAITKAMEMIAAFRFKRAENRFSKAKPYLVEMEKMIGNLSAAAGETIAHPLFEARKTKRKALLVVTGDKGLCGAYNTNLLRAAQNWQREQHGETAIIPVGKVGFEFFRRRQASFLAPRPEKGLIDVSFAKALTEEIKALFLTGQADEIALLYSSYRAGTMGTPKIVPFLGLRYLLEKPAGAGKTQSGADYIYEPDFQTVFITLLERYLEGKVYLTLLEALTSEFSARMVAMKQASDNGEDVLDQLRLLRNKTRQTTITRELSEIVAGANAI